MSCSDIFPGVGCLRVPNRLTFFPWGKVSTERLSAAVVFFNPPYIITALNLSEPTGKADISKIDRTCLELLLIDQLTVLYGEPPSRETRERSKENNLDEYPLNANVSARIKD